MSRTVTTGLRAAIGASFLYGLGLTGPVATTVRADTWSNTVGYVEITAPVGRTVAVANPFAQSGPVSPTAATATAIGAAATAGDFLHAWTGQAFNTYTWSGSAWQIPGTVTAMPEARLNSATGSGCLVSRTGADLGPIRLAGELSDLPWLEVDVAAGQWVLLGCPYPIALTLIDLLTAGAGSHDQVKVWDPAARSWASFSLTDGQWTGPGAADLTIAAGTCFLYLNASETTRRLRFARP